MVVTIAAFCMQLPMIFTPSCFFFLHPDLFIEQAWKIPVFIPACFIYVITCIRIIKCESCCHRDLCCFGDSFSAFCLLYNIPAKPHTKDLPPVYCCLQRILITKVCAGVLTSLMPMHARPGYGLGMRLALVSPAHACNVWETSHSVSCPCMQCLGD